MQEAVQPKRHFFIFDLQQLTFFNKFGIYLDWWSSPTILQKTKAKCNHVFHLHTLLVNVLSNESIIQFDVWTGGLFLYSFNLDLPDFAKARKTSGGSLFKKRKVAIWLFFQSPNKKRGEVLSEEIAVNHFDEGSIRLYVWGKNERGMVVRQRLLSKPVIDWKKQELSYCKNL